MKHVERLAMRTAPWVIPFLTMGIFIFDLVTPVGIAVSIFYVIPMLLTLFTSRRRDSIYFCGLATSLLWIGLFLKPPGSPLLYGVINRTLGTSVLMIVALGLVRFKQLQQKTVETERELTSERVERAHAEGLMMEAQQARYHADRDAMRATVDREEAEGQLLVSQLRLESIIDSAMDAIITVDEDQRVVLFNRAAEQMFGCSDQEAIGQTLDRFMPTRFRDTHHHHVHAFGQSGVTSRKMGKLGTVMGLRSNGEEFPIEAAISHVTVAGKKFYTVILRDITERLVAQQELDNTTTRLRVATESGGIGVWDYSIPDNRLVWDERMYALYGYGPEHVPGAYEAWSQRLHPDDRVEAERVLQEAIAGRKKFDTEFRLQLPDGTTRYIKADALVLKDAQGTPVRMIGVNSDISERKQAEQLLRQSEERYRRLQLRLEGIIESAMDAIITVDEDQRVVLFNQAAEQMFGCSDQEVIGQPIDRFMPTRFRDAHHHHVRGFGQAGVTSRRMGQLGAVSGVRTNGEEFPIEASISHITVEGTKYYTVILRDITERQRVAEELRQQHEFIETVLETAGALVVVLDRQGRILRFNRACEQTTGYSSEEAIGKAVWDFLLVPEEVESAKTVFDRLINREPRNEYESVWVSKDGRRRRIAWSNTVITNQQGDVNYVVGTGIDVTLLIQIQEQLRKTERIAELGTLASGMAHEIGTPMNVILGRAEYLMDRVTEAPIKKGLQTIVTQVERITKVMNQLLAFARRKTPERVPILLTDIVEDSLELFRERLGKSRVAIELALDDHCPRVQADHDLMSQVMINLVMNALHAMEDGGTLRIGLAREKDGVKLTVADTGHGIPRDVIKKVFDPFFTTKEFGKGTGLGLTVVKGIIEEHQGSIAVESEEGKGTTFTILLPQSQ